LQKKFSTRSLEPFFNACAFPSSREKFLKKMLEKASSPLNAVEKN